MNEGDNRSDKDPLCFVRMLQRQVVIAIP